jgi:hypothetical protein
MVLALCKCYGILTIFPITTRYFTVEPSPGCFRKCRRLLNFRLHSAVNLFVPGQLFTFFFVPATDIVRQEKNQAHHYPKHDPGPIGFPDRFQDGNPEEQNKNGKASTEFQLAHDRSF